MLSVYVCSKFIQETVHQISSESPEFYRRYYKNVLVSFFCTHCINKQPRGPGCDCQLAAGNYISKMTYKLSKLGQTDLVFGL